MFIIESWAVWSNFRKKKNIYLGSSKNYYFEAEKSFKKFRNTFGTFIKHAKTVGLKSTKNIFFKLISQIQIAILENTFSTN